jgi:hypothetical protein
MDDNDMQHAPSEISGLPSVAACVALFVGKGPSHAMRLLELGRGLIVGSIIDGRSDASALTVLDPRLYDEFEQARNRLNRPFASCDTIPSAFDKDSGDRAVQGPGSDFELWNQVLGRIRKPPGMEGFQLPPSAGGLKKMAQGVPLLQS